MKIKLWMFIGVVVGSFTALHAAPNVKVLKMDRALSKEAKECIACHAEQYPGMVSDWKLSRHAHSGVSCVDCHVKPKDYVSAAQNCEGVKGTDTYVSALVTPKTCATCHPAEVKEFSQSGHGRAARQIVPKQGLTDLKEKYQGQNHPEFKGAPNENGCMQCHGETIKLDANKQATAATWPNTGIGNIWPDGTTGNCNVCHTRHRFNIAEGRRPDACASCHIGPDHPNIEIYMNSKHGHIYKTEGEDQWNFDSAPDAWEPGDYRAPTCATCHMSGIGDLKTTHNISRRLYWNLWAKVSKKRNSPDPLGMLTGDGDKGRKEMKEVCSNCHTSKLVNNFFIRGDRQVKLYNEAYWTPAKKMLDDLKAKNLLMDNPWKDPFQTTFYLMWHHEGRIMRMGAMMGGPDYAHWHGSFEVMRDLAEMEVIYDQRIKTGKIEH